MSGNFIFYGLVGFSVSVTLGYLARATSKEAVVNAQGQFVLKMHRLYFIVGIISFVFAAVLLLSPLFVEDADAFMYVMIFCMLLLFGGGGLLCVFYFKRHWVVFDEKRVEVCSPSGKMSSIMWGEIIKAKFNPSMGFVTLRGDRGQRVRVHYHLVGFPKFLEYLEEHTSFSAKQLRVPVYRKRQAFGGGEGGAKKT